LVIKKTDQDHNGFNVLHMAFVEGTACLPSDCFIIRNTVMASGPKEVYKAMTPTL